MKLSKFIWLVSIIFFNPITIWFFWLVYRGLAQIALSYLVMVAASGLYYMIMPKFSRPRGLSSWFISASLVIAVVSAIICLLLSQIIFTDHILGFEELGKYTFVTYMTLVLMIPPFWLLLILGVVLYLLSFKRLRGQTP